MLFDLRGRGRRTTVRFVYIGLAGLFLLGFVGLGVGGGFGSGGILSSLSKEEGGGETGYSKQIAKYRKLTQEQPKNVSAWENLAKYLVHEAGSEKYSTTAGGVTSKGKELFKEASSAWEGYIALNPPKPNAELAQLMETVYGEGGLNEDAKEVEVLQVAVAARPTDAALYAALAEYAYKAKNTRVGDLATTKAVALAPASDRQRVKSELESAKKGPSSQILTTTTNGTTYTGKASGSGGFVGTAVKTTAQPSTKTSTTTSTSTGK